MRRFSSLFVDHLLGVIEAASALDLATLTGVRLLGSASAAPGGSPDLALRDAVADADDHRDRISIMRTIRKY
jgi:hypothetical protein